MRKSDDAAKYNNVRKRTTHGGFVAHARGKPEAFTEKENQAMRHVLRTLRKRQNWTTKQTGDVIGVSQQTASKLVGSGRAGFSRPTALRLAHHCGFDSPEAMLRDLGAVAETDAAPGGWMHRDIAVAAAKRMGYPAEAIDRVVARYTDERYGRMVSRWWMDRIVQTAAELDAERAATPAPESTRDISKASTEHRRRRKGVA